MNISYDPTKMSRTVAGNNRTNPGTSGTVMSPDNTPSQLPADASSAPPSSSGYGGADGFTSSPERTRSTSPFSPQGEVEQGKRADERNKRRYPNVKDSRPRWGMQDGRMMLIDPSGPMGQPNYPGPGDRSNWPVNPEGQPRFDMSGAPVDRSNWPVDPSGQPRFATSGGGWAEMFNKISGNNLGGAGNRYYDSGFGKVNDKGIIGESIYGGRKDSGPSWLEEMRGTGGGDIRSEVENSYMKQYFDRMQSDRSYLDAVYL